MPIKLPITSDSSARREAPSAVDTGGVEGSIRQRGVASWELRVYAGIDPDTGRRRYRTATVRGNRADAERGLANLIAEVRADRAVGATSTLSELLEAWFAIAAVSWAPTTVRQTRSVLDRYLHPHLGSQHVGEITPAMIDATYAILRERGSTHGASAVARDARPRPRRAALGVRPSRSAGDGCGTTPRSTPTASSSPTPSCTHRRQPS